MTLTPIQIAEIKIRGNMTITCYNDILALLCACPVEPNDIIMINTPGHNIGC
jgi:hypothetical protein